MANTAGNSRGCCSTQAPMPTTPGRSTTCPGSSATTGSNDPSGTGSAGARAASGTPGSLQLTWPWRSYCKTRCSGRPLYDNSDRVRLLLRHNVELDGHLSTG
jgi:hypothetical protein